MSTKEYYVDTLHLPSSLDQLLNDEQSVNWKGPDIKQKDLKDPWETPYYYQYFPGRNGYQLYTLGADHKLNGTEQASDQISDASLKLIESYAKNFNKIP